MNARVHIDEQHLPNGYLVVIERNRLRFLALVLLAVCVALTVFLVVAGLLDTREVHCDRLARGETCIGRQFSHSAAWWWGAAICVAPIPFLLLARFLIDPYRPVVLGSGDKRWRAPREPDKSAPDPGAAIDATDRDKLAP
ncbi:hypothetical protein [Candidatus Poriferisodalis sp.]|uniref:hypothetical protein n=1 Tax=Candidatus Poriferisodalis sp. TaxID=3101277 RepID=UPI003C6FCCBF